MFVHYANIHFSHQGWLDDLPKNIQDPMDIRLGDIRDGDFMDELTKGREVVMHLAALIAIPFSYHSPR